MFGQFYEVIAQAALIFIDQVLFSLYLVKFILLIFVQKIHGTVNILTKFLCHTTHGTMTLSDCKCRIVQKTFFQKVEICLVFQFFCAVFYQPAYQFLNLRYEREQNTYSCHTEYRIQECDCYRCHDHIHKSEMYDCIHGIEDHRPEDQTKQVVNQVNKSCTLTVFIRTDRRDQDWTCSTYTDTKNDRECTGKCQDTSHR